MNPRPQADPEAHTTRDRLLDLLRCGARTADELAAAVGFSSNAVRQHLVSLERDGAVVRRGPRREGAVGKPAVLYAVAPETEASFSRAYAPVLTALLATLPDHIPRRKTGELLRDAADRLASELPVARGDFTQRVQSGAEVLNALGAITEIAGDQSRAVISGCSCPLARAVAVQPGLCRMLARTLSTVIGADVRESCDRSARPRCRFEVTSTSRAA